MVEGTLGRSKGVRGLHSPPPLYGERLKGKRQGWSGPSLFLSPDFRALCQVGVMKDVEISSSGLFRDYLGFLQWPKDERNVDLQTAVGSFVEVELTKSERGR